MGGGRRVYLSSGVPVARRAADESPACHGRPPDRCAGRTGTCVRTVRRSWFSQLDTQHRGTGTVRGQDPARDALRGPAPQACRTGSGRHAVRLGRGGRRARRPAGRLVRPRLHAAGDRGSAGPGRSGVEPALLASALVGPRRLHRAALASARSAAAGRDPDLPRPLRPPGHGHRPASRARSRHRSWCRWASAPTWTDGACRATASSSWTGTTA